MKGGGDEVWRGLYAMRDGAAMPQIMHRLLTRHLLRYNHVQTGEIQNMTTNFGHILQDSPE
jgi:hypothetical protein